MKETPNAYAILEESNADRLVQDVLALMADGWMPIGGIAVTRCFDSIDEPQESILYTQAMYKLRRADGGGMERTLGKWVEDEGVA